MKKMDRLLALIVAVMMALCCCAFAEEAAPAAAEDPVLFTLDGQAYAKSQVDEVLTKMLENGYLENASDYDAVIEAMIQDKVYKDKVFELGLDHYTEEEKEAFEAEALEEWNKLLDDYVSYFLTEDSQEAREEMRANAEAYYRNYGWTLDEIVNNLLEQDIHDQLLEKLYNEQNTPVSEEEMQTFIDEYIAEQKETYEGNISLYEFHKDYYGYPIWYQPDGYRAVLHILIQVDEALLTAYQDAQNAYEESVSEGENGDNSATLKAAAEAARQAVLDSEKAAIEDIYARLEKGESFESLIALYGDDPSMEDPEYLKNGYMVHKESITMDTAFIEGAFQEKMQHPGDVSDPVVSSFGIHILYYLKDVPAGSVELSDEFRAQIRDYLESVAKNDLFYTALETWEAEHEISLNAEAIAAAKAAAPADEGALQDGDDLGTLTEEELQQLFDQLSQDAAETEDAAPEEAPAE